jgi:hypothetical protein
VSGEEIYGNDVEGVLAFKQPWPSMTRTVWGAHKRYMDTYLNVYEGYYVCLKFPRCPISFVLPIYIYHIFYIY